MGRRDVGPKPWSCNPAPGAIWCTHHGDCTCRFERNPSCRLHGDDTDHPHVTTLVGRAAGGVHFEATNGPEGGQ